MLTLKVFPMALCLCVIRQSDAGSVLLLRPSRGACKQSLCISKYFTASRALFSFGEIIFILALKWNIFVRRLSAESGEEAHTQLAACDAKIIIVRHSSVT